MKKIPTLFQRNEDGLVRDELTPGTEWVANAEGWATRMWNGTCCLIRGGKLYKRNTINIHKGKAPANFLPACDPDPATGKQPGWVPVGVGPENKWHKEAFEHLDTTLTNIDGTYELCGPKIEGNKQGYDKHVLKRHGSVTYHNNVPRTFDELPKWFKTQRLLRRYIEGLVWYHSDGRMAKIKQKDFGL